MQQDDDPILSLKSPNKLYITSIFSFFRYYAHIMLLIWSKKLELCLMVLSVLILNLWHTQISVPKIGIPISKTAYINPWLQATSIPWLELMGVLFSTNLLESIMNSLQIPKEQIYFWTISMNVLWWLKNRRQALTMFVVNLSARIQPKTSSKQWKCVQSRENPADLLARGLLAVGLELSNLWWNRPKFLHEPKDKWQKINVISTAVISKGVSKKSSGRVRWGAEVAFYIMTDTWEQWRLLPKRFSTW